MKTARGKKAARKRATKRTGPKMAAPVTPTGQPERPSEVGPSTQGGPVETRERPSSR